MYPNQLSYVFHNEHLTFNSGKFIEYSSIRVDDWTLKYIWYVFFLFKIFKYLQLADWFINCINCPRRNSVPKSTKCEVIVALFYLRLCFSIINAVALRTIKCICDEFNDNHQCIRLACGVEDMDVFSQEYRQVRREACKSKTGLAFEKICHA